MKGVEQVELRPEDAEVATQTTTRPLFAITLAIETVPSAFCTQPTAPTGHEHTTEGGAAVHPSTAHAEKATERRGLHSTAAVGPLQVMAGGRGVIVMVSEHVAVLPEASVAEQLTTMPLFAYTEGTETEPSALSVVPVGAVHTALTEESQQSEATAETADAQEPHTADELDSEQVIAGFVVSLTVSELVHVALRPVAAETAVQVMTAPLLPIPFAMETVPFAFCVQYVAPGGHEHVI